MLLPKKINHAVNMMVCIAKHEKTKSITLDKVAINIDLSVSFLEQIITLLKKSGLVLSARGPNGGYRLALDEHDISVGMIAMAVLPETNGDFDYLDSQIFTTMNAINLSDVIIFGGAE